MLSAPVSCVGQGRSCYTSRETIFAPAMSRTSMRLICIYLLGVVASPAFRCSDRADEGRLTPREYQAAVSDIVNHASKASSLYLDIVAERLPVSTCRSGGRAFETE